MLRSKNIYIYMIYIYEIYQDLSNMLSTMQHNKKGKNIPPCQDWPYIQEAACAAQHAELVSLMDEVSKFWRSIHSGSFEFSSVRMDDRIGRKSRCGCGCGCGCG